MIGLVSRFIGANAVGLAMGILLAFHSIGAAIGAAIGSHAFDNDGHYDVVLAVCCGLWIYSPSRRGDYSTKRAFYCEGGG